MSDYPKNLGRHRSLIALVCLALMVSACGGATPEEQLATAQQAFEQRDYRSSSIAVRSLLQDQPENGQARLLLGLVSLATGDTPTAESELYRARDLGVDDIRLALGIAELMLRKGQPTEAQVVLAGIPDGEQNERVQLLLVDTMLLLGEFDAAEQRIDMLVAASDDPNSWEIRRGRVLLARGDAVGAAEQVTRLMKQQPDSAQVYRLAGLVAQNQNNFVSAAQRFEKAAALAASSGESSLLAESWYSAAVTRLRARQFDEAGIAVERYEAVMGENPAAQFMRASILFEQQQYSEANGLLRKAATSAPGNPNILRLLGASDLALGNLGQARQNLQASMNASSQPDPVASRLLAEVHLRQGRPELALDVLRESGTDAMPNIMLLAQTLISVGDVDEAIDLLSKNEAEGRSTPALRILLARAHASSGDIEQAEVVLRKSIDLDSEDYGAVIGLLQTYLGQGDAQSGVALTEQLIDDRKDDPRAYAAAALFLQTVGESDGALARAREATQRFPGNIGSHLLLGNIALGVPDQAQALAAFDAALAIDPDSIDALIGKSQISAMAEDSAESKSLLERAAAVAGSDPRPFLTLARLAITERNFADAKRWASSAIEVAPARAEAHAIVGAALAGEGDIEGARAALSKAIEQSDATPGNYLALVFLAETERSSDGVMQALESGLARFPQNATLLLAGARFALANSDVSEAERLVADLLSRDADNPDGLILKGRVAAAQRQYVAAQAAYKDALASGAGEAAVLGQYRTAISSGEARPERYLTSWLSRFPDSIAIRALLAQHYQTTDNEDQAEELYRAIIAESPRNAVALNNLAWMLHQSGDDEALELARRAADIAPNSAAILDTYGVILLDNGAIRDALPLLTKAVELAADNAEIRYHLARAQVVAGDPGQARENLQTVLASTLPESLRREAQSLLESLE